MPHSDLLNAILNFLWKGVRFIKACTFTKVKILPNIPANYAEITVISNLYADDFPGKRKQCDLMSLSQHFYSVQSSGSPSKNPIHFLNRGTDT